MKKIILILISLFLTVAADANIRNIQDNDQIVYNIIDVSGNHVSGQTVTLQIKRVSDGFWFDFNDSTFKNSGWTNKTTNLSENSTDGFYFYTFNPPASETGVEQYQYLINNDDSTYGDHQSSTVSYQNIGTSSLTVADNIGVNFSDISGTLDASEIGDDAITAAKIAASAITSSEAPNLDATVSSRSSQTSVDTIDDFVDTEVAAIKAKTDQLVFTTANKVDARTFTNDDKTGYSLAADQAVNVTKWSGTTVATPDTAGYPKVTIKSGTGTGEINLSSGVADANAVKMSGTALTARDVGASVLLSSGTGTGQVSLSSGTVTVGTNNDKAGYALSAAGVDSIWDEAQSGHTTSGTFGKYLDAQVSTISGGSAPTAAQVADAVWDETISDHLGSGSTGNKLNTAASSGDPWSTELTGSYTGAQAGFYLPDLIKKSRGR